VTSYLAWIEQTALSVWIRESPSYLAFPAVLILHTVGMAFLVGTAVAVNLRVLGLARNIPISAIARFFPAMWVGFWLNVLSGVALVIATPAKALTNWVFYVKLGLILLALLNGRVLQNQVFNDPAVDEKPVSTKGKVLAATSILLWVGAMITGRLLAYTYVRILSGD